MSTDVFVSVGRTCTREQEEFVFAVEEHLKGNGFSPRCLGRNDFSSQQPLKAISKLMDQCCGTVVIGFARTHIEKAVQYGANGSTTPITEQNLPTVWNQIEATMAYDRQQPLLVVLEEGLKPEGLLESGYDWFVQWVPLSAAPVFTREFLGVFADWKARVEEYRVAKEQKANGAALKLDYGRASIREIVYSLTPGQFWSVAGAVVALLVGVAGLAYKLGSLVTVKP